MTGSIKSHRLSRMFVLKFVVLSAFVAHATAAPDLSNFASAPQPVDTPFYGAPSVGNAWATLLASTSNVLGFNAFSLPPFSAGMATTIDSGSLTVNVAAIVPNTSIWSPYAVQRNGSALVGSIVTVVSSEIRMVFESNIVMVRANVSKP
jgi:hypothetical protein